MYVYAELRVKNGQDAGRTHPFSHHNKLSVETSVTFRPFWIASSVLFVGTAGIYACTAADNHRV